MIIAVDFDGTMCENDYPDIGPPKMDIIRKLIKAQKDGHQLVLWTCRGGKELKEAVEWSKEWGVEFNAVNENAKDPAPELPPGLAEKKIFAHIYLDDRAAHPRDFAKALEEQEIGEK